MKKFLPVVWVAVVVLALFGLRAFYVAEKGGGVKGDTDIERTLTYSIEDSPVTLQNGVAVSKLIAGVGESRKSFPITTQYIKTDAMGDLNGDGMTDKAVILLVTGEENKQLYYLAVARKTSEGYEGTNAIFLGDRIEYHKAEIRGGEIVVHYRDRLPRESEDTQPHMGIAKYFALEGDTLTQIQKTVERSVRGEACRKDGGTWSEEFTECTGITESRCDVLGGVFTACASACRNNKNSDVMCTKECILVCTLAR